MACAASAALGALPDFFIREFGLVLFEFELLHLTGALLCAPILHEVSL